MPERSRKRPRDINALAAAIVSEATDDDREPEDPYEGKDRPPWNLAGPTRSAP